MPDTPKTTGYAVVENGAIDVRTVSPTIRAAKVNFLVVNRGCRIYANDGDEEIQEVWEARNEGAFVTQVDIECSLTEF